MQPNDNHDVTRRKPEPINVGPASPSEWRASTFPGGLLDAGPRRDGPSPAPALNAETFLRWKGTILLVFLLVSGTALPCIWLLMRPVYKATAAVRVSPVVSRMVFKTDDNGVLPMYQQHVNTQARLLTSPNVLNSVLDRAVVRETRWHREAPRPLWGDSPSALDRLREELQVKPAGQSEFIDVSISTLVPRESKLIVDAVVEEYEKISRLTVSETEMQKQRQLDEDYKTCQKEISAKENARYNLSKEIGTLTPEELRSEHSRRLGELESKRAEVERTLAITRFELESLGAAEPAPVDAGATGLVSSAPGESGSRYADDREWRELSLAAHTRKHELELAGLQYGSAHPKVAQLAADVQHAGRLLKDREAQLDAGMTGGAVAGEGGDEPRGRAGLEREARRLEYELGLLQRDVDRQRERVNSAGEIAQRLAELDDELRDDREFCDQLRKTREINETESKAPWHIMVRQASEPSLPDRDRRLLLSVMAMFGGLAGGLALAYLRTATDPTIRLARDLAISPRTPFLGYLPKLPGPLDLSEDSSPWLVECMRMVRTALIERLDGRERPVVLITSCSAGAGKSSVAVLLGRSLAQLGKRVLLVEADLHRPSLSVRLDLAPGPGLLNVLTGQADDPGAIRTTSLPEFDVLPCGDREGFDVELLANGQFSACLARWRKSYAYILLDSPPVLPVADARILSRHADGTLMVLRAAHSRKPDIVRACADIDAAGGAILGSIMVGGASEAGYGEYGYYEGHARPASSPLLSQT